MSNLQVKNVPDAFHRKIRKHAERQGQTIRDFVLEAIRRELVREEFRERLARRSPVELGTSAARVLDEVRGERDREVSG